MRHTFTIAVLVVLAFLVTNKTMMHAQASPKGVISCAKGAELAGLDARQKGFSRIAAGSQAENFLSSCLINGEARVGGLLARD